MTQEYGQVGNSLRQRDVQYVANRDGYGVWRILDTWHKEMSTMTLTDELDIPDDSDAVTLLTEGQFLALMKEVEQQNYMPPASNEGLPFNIAREEYSDDDLEIITKERDELVNTVNFLKQEQNITNSDADKHNLEMRKLDLFETMSNKGTLELDIAEIIKSVGD